MAEFPLGPNYAKVIISSEKFSCVREVIIIISLLTSGQGLFVRPKDRLFHADKAWAEFEKLSSDHLTLLNVFIQWENSGFSELFAWDHFLNLKCLRKAKDISE